eukprot:100216-Pelagomonas_calceolata.AAC.3
MDACRTVGNNDQGLFKLLAVVSLRAFLQLPTFTCVKNVCIVKEDVLSIVVNKRERAAFSALA